MPAPASKLIAILMFLGNAHSPWSSSWLSGREPHLAASLNAPASGFEMGILGRICWHTDDNSLLLQLLVILKVWTTLSLLSASFSGLYTKIKGKNSLYKNYKHIYITRNWTKTLSQYFVSLFCSNVLEFSLNPFTDLAPPTELSSFQQTYSTSGEWMSSYNEHDHFSVI